MTQQSHNSVFVREIDAETLPPPVNKSGVRGWLWRNFLYSVMDYSSVGASIRSLSMLFFSVLVSYVGLTQIWYLIDFVFLSAVWSDPTGIKREACWTVSQGGSLPNDWRGACWPFIFAKLKFMTYGPYPMGELWRVNVTGLLGLAGIFWLLIEALPYRRIVGVLLLTAYPVIALVLLTGGASDANYVNSGAYILVGLALITVGRLGQRGLLGVLVSDFAGIIGFVGWSLIGYQVLMLIFSVDVGLEPVGTGDWGGLMITLVVAVTGIVVSLPLGIILALGRRSNMPVARLLCTIFIEFWRGVPLISVLFMASVMIPLFMPEGVNFDKLMRALIGVMLFSAAYMAEVVRGGLQAIDKGQYEAAEAMGLTYWQSMRQIILPQALTHVIPGIVNTFIGLFKDTTLVSIIGLFDLLGAGKSAIADASWSSPVQAISVYLFVGFIFFIFCFGMSRYSIFMENKLSKSRSH